MEKLINNEELENVSGGLHNYEASAGYKVEVDGVEYDVVDGTWGCPCKDLGNDPIPTGYPFVKLCMHCKNFHYLRDIGKDNINGWNGYCTWE